jgi:hypothetical protein
MKMTLSRFDFVNEIKSDSCLILSENLSEFNGQSVFVISLTQMAFLILELLFKIKSQKAIDKTSRLW